MLTLGLNGHFASLFFDSFVLCVTNSGYIGLDDLRSINLETEFRLTPSRLSHGLLGLCNILCPLTQP